MPAGVSVISHYKPLKKISLFLCFSDITSGSVHLAVWWIDQSTNLPSGLDRFLKQLVMANHTHACWHNIINASLQRTTSSIQMYGHED